MWAKQGTRISGPHHESLRFLYSTAILLQFEALSITRRRCELFAVATFRLNELEDVTMNDAILFIHYDDSENTDAAGSGPTIDNQTNPAISRDKKCAELN
ncbi:BQ5605_C036g11495 [Microbotryum silenes-dioicae]|uniref:BQ5605_C036g11495 protein n=1 Tax=Microbotryum silenes-dioicae TaxID=796604 RepID=A0A2X0MFM3_9BASI|nr:BQ5605_C036g11495 [Microbotryum silenes-dioicae]